MGNTSLLEQLGLNAQEVLQAPNIESTIAQTTNPESALGIYEAQQEAAGVSGFQTAYNTAQANTLAGQQLAQQEQLTIEGRRKRLGVLRGEQAQAGQQAALDIQTLLGSEQLAQTALGQAQGVAQTKAGFLIDEFQQKQNLLIKYPGLDIDPMKDSFNTISEEIGKYTEKQKYIEVLSQYGKNTKGSRGALKKRYKSLLKKLDKKEEAEAKKIEDRADEKWELEKRNINSLINKRDEPDQNKMTSLGNGYYQDSNGNIFFDDSIE